MRVAAIGECMIELSEAGQGLMAMSFGGDTLNTAIYLARCGAAVDYVTALGDDPYSAGMLEAWRAEGVGTGLVSIMPGRVPGLYAIRRDGKGERSFYYWRDRSPARELFDTAGPELDDRLLAFDILYTSGISLSIYSEAGRGRLYGLFDRLRAQGGHVVFDGNYRPRGWPGPESARAAFETVLRRAAFAFPTFEDEAVLFGDADPAVTAGRIAGYGVKEVVVKNGAGPCTIRIAGDVTSVPAETDVRPIDTTAAGDSFNAAYLAARLSGSAPREAALRAHRLAADVIRHPGAIMPRSGSFVY
ncbi:sugar kinase [soil metagenome]